MMNIPSPPPIISLFIPAPVDIHVTTNTFVRFSCNGESDVIGLITGINAASSRLTVRHFWSWEQLCNHPGANVPPNVTFWPLLQQNHPPHFIYDTDVTSEISTSSIRGLAYVFHEDDPFIHQLCGMANTYKVSSCFKSTQMVLVHGHTFCSSHC